MGSAIAYTRGYVIETVLHVFVTKGGDASTALRAVSLPDREDIDPADVILAEQYFELMQVMTEMLGDPYFPARIGEYVAQEGVSVLVAARNESKTMGEFLIKVLSIFRRTLTSGIYELNTDGERATLSVRRPLKTKASATPVDILNAAGFITIFRNRFGNDALHDCIATVPDPAALPPDILTASQVFRSADGKMRIQFPADWLQAELEKRWEIEALSEKAAAAKSVERFEIEALRHHISKGLGPGRQTLEQVAGDFAMSTRQLQRLLQVHGQTFRGILKQERLTRVKHLLEATDTPIVKIAESCGFSSAQALSKSFSAAFGEAPSLFRRRNRGEG